MKSKVLITGAGGFIGSHLAELCVESGYDVRALVRYNSQNSRGWLERSKHINEIEVVTGDVRDLDSTMSAVNGCDTIFHLAALIGIPYSYLTPLAYVKTNIEGTYNILQAARANNIENVLITSTSETYGTAQYVPMDENHPPNAQSPYSATKIGADQLALSYHRSFALPVRVVRPFNTYGPRQSARAIIPSIISQVLKRNGRIKVGNIKPTRDLTYVKDTVQGILAISKSPELIGQVTNVGMNQEISIYELIKLIGSLMQTNIEIERESQRIRVDTTEVDRLWCDNKKLVTMTNWKPKFNLEQGLAATIEWVEENIENYKSEIYNV